MLNTGTYMYMYIPVNWFLIVSEDCARACMLSLQAMIGWSILKFLDLYFYLSCFMQLGTFHFLSRDFVFWLVPLENFSLIWRRFHNQSRTANFDICSAFMAIEQWGFFSMPDLLWHGHPFIMVISEDPWHSHLLPSVLQWSCHYLFWRIYDPSRLGSYTQPSSCEANVLTDCATAAVCVWLRFLLKIMQDNNHTLPAGHCLAAAEQARHPPQKDSVPEVNSPQSWWLVR